jgi:hypothetical protein
MRFLLESRYIALHYIIEYKTLRLSTLLSFKTTRIDRPNQGLSFPV